MITLKLAWREIQQSKRFALFFIFNLSLGLFGFLLLDAFKTSFDQSLKAQSQAMLTADVAVSTRRVLKANEAETIERAVGPNALESKASVLYSMVSTPASGSSRLVELVAIDSNYPLYGEIKLASGSKIHGVDLKEITEKPLVWVSPEFEAQMGVKKGDVLQIGASTFVISDFVTSDTSNNWQGMSFAPRIYLGQAFLEKTGLILPGSTVNYRFFYRLPEDRSEEVLSKLEQGLDDPSVQVASHRSASAQTGRFIHYLNDYLGLVSLVALFLAAVGAGYLFRSFLGQRLKEIGIYMSLGLTHADARKIYLVQLALLGSTASLVASALSLLALPKLISYLRDRFHFPIAFSFSGTTLVLSLLLGSVGSMVICFPLLERISHLKVSQLFQDRDTDSASDEKETSWRERWRKQLPWAPSVFLFSLLAIWQANSIRTGLLFVALFAGAGFLLSIAGSLVLMIFERLARNRKLKLKLAFRSMAKNRASSLSCFLAIGLGSLLINLIPQIQKNLETEIVKPEVSEVPSLFFFDIQAEQIGEFSQFVKNAGFNLKGVSPLIRARLEKLNGKPFEKKISASSPQSREEEKEEKSRNRGFNLTYRGSLTESESISSGVGFSAQPGEVPEISVEKEFAERLKIQLNDILSFDVQGVPVEGKVVNLRKVKWTSFQPNFFIQFQPGVLDDAPKTYLASVAHLNLSERSGLQNQVVKKFSNISIIDITQVIEKLLALFGQMGIAIALMAALSVSAGLVVIFSIANHQARSRRAETELLKILGARFSDIQMILLTEFVLIGLLAALMGAGLSIAMSFGISRFLFDGLWVLSLKMPILSVLAIVILSALTTWFATARVLRQKRVLLGESA